ncbi:gfo/Idh/MocA family oxidoreductase [Amycolatopsis balhimycina DSM 5908]|uniref:Gfo/Idh/MocA family oxidoreductase n=1 Tax=Amycolatopsis balhimycina DSM 5908 TaxID=1081091 RepID=A0A428WJX9_AMYBA|nr:Gfo/Idh/MocA family oxidoreductase [Amycolatopsis balhimycina]RSM43373.1 gfo/Idh/MocA family oxidoreductase [Amycolatopsis balhimycina DSM 5908]
MTDKPLRWGIMGTGLIAGVFAEDLKLTGSGVVAAVGSRTAGSAARFADEHRVPVRHSSYEALANDPDVDVVYVATPHPLHHGNARLALEAGKPVLVEKPFTMSAGEARDLVELARTKNLFLMEAMWTRFLPHIRHVRELLPRLGDVVTVSADHGQWFAEDPAFRLFAPELGGGALLDLGIYPVSFASMVLGAPDRVAAMATPAFTGVDAQMSMLFGYPSGAQAVLTCTLSAVSPTTAWIAGTDGHIEIEGPFYAPASFTFVPREGEPSRHEYRDEGRGLRHQADEVALRLAAGETESPLMPLDETVSIMTTMDAVLAATRT